MKKSFSIYFPKFIQIYFMADKYQYSNGELYVQERADVVEDASRVSRIIKNSADGFAQDFIETQLFCFISSMDGEGSVWTSMLAGKQPGFARVITPNKLFFSQDKFHRFSDDILHSNIVNNPSVGILFIDLTTRRRQRLNGSLYSREDGLHLEIEQSFVNCPKYIQLRTLENSHSLTISEVGIEKGLSILPARLKDIIENSDTFYLGTAGKNKSLDTSHRGGNSGFVKFIKDDTLRIPDYSGNNMFISLGNIHEYPEASLLFLDDESRSILQLQGEAELSFDEFGKEDEHPTGGTGRYWYFRIKQYHLLKNVLPYTWRLVEFSSFNP